MNSFFVSTFVLAFALDLALALALMLALVMNVGPTCQTVATTIHPLHFPRSPS